MAKKKKVGCMDWCSGKKGFPSFAVIILVLAVLWLLGDVGVIKTDVPWFPVVLIVIAIGWIIDNYSKEK